VIKEINKYLVDMILINKKNLSGRDFLFYTFSLMENGLPFCVAEGTLQCPCLENFSGIFCNECTKGYFEFPECKRKRDDMILDTASNQPYHA
jgi:hypothetical protein